MTAAPGRTAAHCWRGAAALALAGRAAAQGLAPKQTLFVALKPGASAAFAALAAHEAIEGHAARIMLNRVVVERSPDAPYQAVVEVEGADREIRASLALRNLMAAPPLTMCTHPASIKPLDPAAPHAAKRIGLVGRTPGAAKADFDRDWRLVHAPPVAAQPELSAYLLNIAASGEDARTGWDGYAELWWPDWAACDRATAARLKTRTDAGFFHKSLLLYVEEQA